MALFLNGKQLQCGNAIAAKPWTTLGTLTEGSSSLNVSGYTELLIYPKINGTTYFDPFVIDVSEFNNASTIHFSIYQDDSHSYMGGLDYSDGSISFRRILISGWVSCDCVVKATCFSSGGSTTHHYSENEQIVGTWIDGKTLYEKTVIITNASKDASYDLGITDFDTCFVYNGSFSGNGTIPYLHGSFPDNSIGGFLDDTGSSLAWAFRSGSQVPATISGFITVRYTKTST